MPRPSPIETDPRWNAVLTRNAGFDGKFVYAVKTTGVYCRPSCPSRRAKPENFAFYATDDEAAQAGFRACKRCRPQ
jgi:AraC family transcriptional regulator, regulatory protein of adaptative response / methylated-DNA-[protein]-cysteine methyltransferase